MRITWIQPEDLVGHELRQAREEQKDVDAIEERWLVAGGAPAPGRGASPDPVSPELRALANHGLRGFTPPRTRAADALRGASVVNDGFAAAWGSLDAPMGGMKQSGVGRRHGREGLLKYTESQTIALRTALAEKLQTPGTDPSGYARRFTKILKAAKHLPR